MNNQKPSNRMHYGLPRMALACRGNTLAPVVIALFISALASIAFLQQGAQLSEKQKLIRAPEEVMEIINEWIRVRSSKDYIDIKTPDLSFHKEKNVFGHKISYNEVSNIDLANVEYRTHSETTCKQLKSILDKNALMVNAECGDYINPKETLVISFRGRKKW